MKTNVVFYLFTSTIYYWENVLWILNRENIKRYDEKTQSFVFGFSVYCVVLFDKDRWLCKEGCRRMTIVFLLNIPPESHTECFRGDFSVSTRYNASIREGPCSSQY